MLKSFIHVLSAKLDVAFQHSAWSKTSLLEASRTIKLPGVSAQRPWNGDLPSSSLCTSHGPNAPGFSAFISYTRNKWQYYFVFSWEFCVS